jgi:hypothetical protein
MPAWRYLSGCFEAKNAKPANGGTTIQTGGEGDPREPGSRFDDLSGRLPCHAMEGHRAAEMGRDCPRVIRFVEDGRT